MEQAEFVRYNDSLVMHSEILGTDINFAVLLPSSYETDGDKTYPVVYMLHGYGDNYRSWNGRYLHANTRIQTLEGQGLSEMIYVFPNGFNTYYCNYWSGKYNYMDMFVNELVPYIDKTFRTIPDREHRALTGYSMGGFGAMVLAEKHPEIFSCSAPLSMSFRTDAQYMAESQSGWDDQWGKIFGGIGKSGEERLTDYYKEHCPYYQFNEANKAVLGTVNWFFTCGDDEQNLLIAGDSLHVLLRDRGYAHEYRVGNGGHTSSYWMEALFEVLPYFDHYMNGTIQWPECALKSYTINSLDFKEDGVVLSSAFDMNDSNRGVLFCHRGLSEEELKEAMGVMWSSNTKYRFAFLPCNLNEKGIEDWEKHWEERYSIDSWNAVAFGDAAQDVLQRKEDFKSIVMANPLLSDPVVESGDNIFFSTTDDGSGYLAADELYLACKRSGANFEYRVIQDSGNAREDRLRQLSLLNSYMTYN